MLETLLDEIPRPKSASSAASGSIAYTPFQAEREPLEDPVAQALEDALIVARHDTSVLGQDRRHHTRTLRDGLAAHYHDQGYAPGEHAARVMVDQLEGDITAAIFAHLTREVEDDTPTRRDPSSTRPQQGSPGPGV